MAYKAQTTVETIIRYRVEFNDEDIAVILRTWAVEHVEQFKGLRPHQVECDIEAGDNNVSAVLRYETTTHK